MGTSHSHSQKRQQSASSARYQDSYPAYTGGSAAYGSQPSLRDRPPSAAATMSSKQRRKAGTYYKVLLDKKATFHGRYFARQFSDAVLERLRMHVRQSTGSKTRIRLSTDGVAVGSKNSNLFVNVKTPYEFFPLAEISDIIVESELRNVLLLIKELSDGTLEILAYRLINEPEARLFQQTFDEIAVKAGGRGQLYAQKQPAGNWTFTTSARPVDNVDHQGTWRSAHAKPGGYHSMTMLNDGTNRRTGNYWGTTTGRTPGYADGYVYRLRSEDSLGTPASHRRRSHHKSDSDATMEEHYRRDIEELTREVSELRTAMRDRSTTNDSHHVVNNNIGKDDGNYPDGPIRLVFSKDGIIETHGVSSVVREGSDSGSDRDSGIHSKDHGGSGGGDLVDGGPGTVRARAKDYRIHRTTATTTARNRSSVDTTDLDTRRSYDNGYGTTQVHRSGGYTARSAGGVTHHVLPGDDYAIKRSRGVSPAPSLHSRTQSEGGWRLRLPWRRRSQSADAKYRQPGQRWDNASVIIGGRTARKIYVPDGRTPPERIILYPTGERQVRSRHASRYEL